MQALKIDKEIEKSSEKKKYMRPQLHVMGKMKRLTKNKNDSSVDAGNPGTEVQGF